MGNSLSIITVLFFLVVCSTVAFAVDAEPILPSFFYGMATVNGRAVPVESRVIAKINNEFKGSIRVLEAGKYGTTDSDWKLAAIGGRDDIGETIHFYVKLPGKQEIPSTQTFVYEPGTRSYLDLVFTGQEIDEVVPPVNNSNTTTVTNNTGDNSIRSQYSSGGSETFVYNAITGNIQLSMFLANERIPITELQMLLRNPVASGATIRFDAYDNSPSTTLANAYKYISIDAPLFIDSNIRTAVIRFQIPNSWFTQNGMNPDTVVLYRYVNNAWIPLRTLKEGSDSEGASYRAGTPGFSYFAIGANRSSGAQATPTPSPTPNLGAQLASPTPEPRNPRDLRDDASKPKEDGTAGQDQITGAAVGTSGKADPKIGILIIGGFVVLGALTGIIVHTVLRRSNRKKR